MAYEVRLTRRAIGDLRHIYQNVEAETSVAADTWFRGLEAAIFSLEDDPARGAITRERPRLRQLLYGNKPHVYRIIYSISESERRVNVAQIRHGARRPLTLGTPERFA
jgi:plasmid stabilization system protein ParE